MLIFKKEKKVVELALQHAEKTGECLRIMIEAVNAAMGKGNALIETCTAEPLAFNETFENGFTGKVRTGADEQFAQNFKTVFLAARMCVAQDAVGLDYFFEQHWVWIVWVARTAGPPYGPDTGSVFDLVSFPGTVINQFFFVFSYSSFEFINEAVNGGVHIFFGVVCVNRTTVHVYAGFCLVAQFLDRKDAVDVGDEVKMSLDLLDF